MISLEQAATRQICATCKLARITYPNLINTVQPDSIQCTHTYEYEDKNHTCKFYVYNPDIMPVAEEDVPEPNESQKRLTEILREEMAYRGKYIAFGKPAVRGNFFVDNGNLIAIVTEDTSSLTKEQLIFLQVVDASKMSIPEKPPNTVIQNTLIQPVNTKTITTNIGTGTITNAVNSMSDIINDAIDEALKQRGILKPQPTTLPNQNNNIIYCDDFH